MFKLSKFFILFVSLFVINKSYGCEEIMNDFPNEIKAYAGDSAIQELNGCYYVDAKLLSLQEDGIHLIYGDKDVLVPFMFHDTYGYFLSPQACHNMGNNWMCCRCNTQNNMFRDSCRTCFKARCR